MNGYGNNRNNYARGTHYGANNRYGYKNYKNGKKNYRNNQHDSGGYNGYNRHNSKNNHGSKHPEHPVRDAIYAVLGCYVAIGFALLWIGLQFNFPHLVLVGTITGVMVAISATFSFVRAFKGFKARKRYGNQNF